MTEYYKNLLTFRGVSEYENGAYIENRAAKDRAREQWENDEKIRLWTMIQEASDVGLRKLNGVDRPGEIALDPRAAWSNVLRFAYVDSSLQGWMWVKALSIRVLRALRAGVYWPYVAPCQILPDEDAAEIELFLRTVSV